MSQKKTPVQGEEACRQLPVEELERLFFAGPALYNMTPSDAVKEAWEEAKEICIECPVFVACMEKAPGQLYGVWAGRDQHERHLARKRAGRRLLKASPEERADLARRVHEMHRGGNGLTLQAIATRVGHGPETCRKLLAEHNAFLREENPPRRQPARLTAEEKALILSKVAEGVTHAVIAASIGRHESTISNALKRWRGEAEVAERVRPFPEAHPDDGSAWIRHHDGLIHPGFYLGETEDGAYLYMKVNYRHTTIRTWAAKCDVDLRAVPVRSVMTWNGRPKDGVQTQVTDAA